MKTRADIERQLARLQALAKRSPFKAERESALAKVELLRKMLGTKPREQRQHVASHVVDVSESTDIKDAFRMAFKAAFDDIRTTMRAEGTSKPCPKEDDPEIVVRRMGMKVRYK
jgi:hypothetical protein